MCQIEWVTQVLCFVFLCVWHAVKWAVQIFAPLCVDQMDSSVLECLASHKKQIDGDNVIACQEKKKMCQILHLPQNEYRTTQQWASVMQGETIRPV